MHNTNEGRYWPVVSTLGRLDPANSDLDNAADALDGLDPGQLFDRIVDARVYTLAQRHLERIAPNGGPASELLGRLRTLGSQEQERRRLARPETIIVLGSVRKFGARVIKGLALREFYSDVDARHEGDIDLQVPNWESAVALAVWLRGRSWCWDVDEFSWIKWTDGGHLYGQLSLVFPGTAEAIARADVHIGPFSVGYAGLLPLAGWEFRDVLGVPSTVPGPEATFALIVAHAVNDGLLSMKDINDLHVLLASRAAPDWGCVEELCRAFSGVGTMRHLLAAVASIYVEHPAPPGPVESVLATVASRGHIRADRFAMLALRDELARGVAPDTAIAVAREARRYFSADLSPRLSDEVVMGPVAEERSRGNCWRLLPHQTWKALGEPQQPTGLRTATDIAPGLGMVRRGSGIALITGGEVFIPTLWGAVHPESLALAEAEL